MRFKKVLGSGCVLLSLALLGWLPWGPALSQEVSPPEESPFAAKVITSESSGESEPSAADNQSDPSAADNQSDRSSATETQARLRPAPADGSLSADSSSQPGSSSTAPVATTAEEEPLVPIPDPQGTGPVRIEAASFRGVVPGVTTTAEVEQAWGAPKEMKKVDNVLTQLYSIETFKRIEVSYYEDTVASIVIRLDHTFPATVVAEQLGLTGIRPVLVSDELGNILGQSYPERGVLFAFAESDQPGKVTTHVEEVILEPVSAEPFVLRAETNLHDQYELSLADLDHALKLEPGNARACWLKARILVAMGRFDEAVAASGQAVRLDPSNARYRVTRGQILGQVGRLAEAVQEAKKALETSQKRPHVKARALCLLGDLMASGSQPNYKGAIQYHMQAIQEADALATSRHPAVRVAAKKVLIDAHLGAAHDIAWGDWKEKQKAVPRWLDRAVLLAEEMIDKEDGNQEHRFRVASRALAVCVGLSGSLDAEKWTKMVVSTGEQLIAETDDPLRKAQYQWDLGMALYDALQIYQMRNDHQTALKYGEWAIDYLEEGDRQKRSATTGYLLGRLYFRLGAIHAIRDQNHRAAISWFEKAIPLLQKPVPTEAVADLGRHGETFVSMGVSFWASGQRKRAVELTRTGVEVMEQAVKQGSLPEQALAVPYSNLATMYRQLDLPEEAERFEKLAETIEDTRLR